MEGRKIIRKIYIFNLSIEHLVDEYDLSHLDVRLLKEIFNVRDDDPEMVLAYNIENKEADKLKPHVTITFDFNRYCYEISA